MTDVLLAPGNRGLHYGDGLFETLLCLRGHVWHWPLHLARLRAGCDRLGIAPPEEAPLLAQIRPLTRQDGVIKLLWIRGGESTGYAPDAGATPQLWVTARPLPPGRQRQQHGICARWCHLRLAHNPRLAGIKHLNRLEQVLARAEWRDENIEEGLLLDQEGWVVEGVASNLFVVRDGALLTPRLDRAGVAGVMRAAIMRAASVLGIPCQEVRLTAVQVMQADEVFVSNAVLGLRPLRRLGRRIWPEPALTRRLQALLAREDVGA